MLTPDWRHWLSIKPGAEHGKLVTYDKYGCRCDPCRQARRIAAKASRERLKNAPIPEHVHGTANGYRHHGCRCTACTEARRLENWRAT